MFRKTIRNFRVTELRLVSAVYFNDRPIILRVRQLLEVTLNDITLTGRPGRVPAPPPPQEPERPQPTVIPQPVPEHRPQPAPPPPPPAPTQPPVPQRTPGIKRPDSDSRVNPDLRGKVMHPKIFCMNTLRL